MSEQAEKVRRFFNREYEKVLRYWWRGANRYDLDPANHTVMNATLLTLAGVLGTGTVLDLGAGEGADSIRLAKMGFDVTAVELSDSGAKKIAHFAKEAGVRLNVVRADAADYPYSTDFDIILCQGILQYIEDKAAILEEIKSHTKPSGLNAISCFTDSTPTPECHQRVPVFPDREDGCIMDSYKDWHHEYLVFERNIPEHSHPCFPPHSHSFIKLIARKCDNACL